MSGDGDSAHLGAEEGLGDAPKIELANGLFEIGRVDPADIVIPIPSVSGRHAMLRVGVLLLTLVSVPLTVLTWNGSTKVGTVQMRTVSL